jgi:transcriptional regulator with XRE-family HTH domain
MAIFRAERSAELRRRTGLTQAEAALRAGCSTPMLVKIENSICKPSIALLCQLARTYNCRVGAFFDEDQPDLLADDDPRPSSLGTAVETFIAKATATMPPMDPDTARRVSGLLFPQATPPEAKSRRRRAAS